MKKDELHFKAFEDSDLYFLKEPEKEKKDKEPAPGLLDKLATQLKEGNIVRDALLAGAASGVSFFAVSDIVKRFRSEDD